MWTQVDTETERLCDALRHAMAPFLESNAARVNEAQAAVVDAAMLAARAALAELQSGLVGRMVGNEGDASPNCVLLPLAPEVASRSVDVIAAEARAAMTTGLTTILAAGEVQVRRIIAITHPVMDMTFRVIQYLLRFINIGFTYLHLYVQAVVDRAITELRGRELQSFMVANTARVKGEKEAAAADVASSFVGRFKAALGGRSLPVSDAMWTQVREREETPSPRTYPVVNMTFRMLIIFDILI
jgi:hypothetical protein